MFICTSVAERWFGDILMMRYITIIYTSGGFKALKKKNVNAQFTCQCNESNNSVCCISDKYVIDHARHLVFDTRRLAAVYKEK